MKKIVISILFVLICITLGTADIALSYEDEFNDQAISTIWAERVGTGGNFVEDASGMLKITSSSGGVIHTQFDPAYLHQPVSGDFDIYVKVEAADIDTPYETAGIIFYLDDSNWVSCGLLSIRASEITFNRIDTNNQSSSARDLPSGTGRSPCWLRMKRVGSDFNCYYALSTPTVNNDWIEIPSTSTTVTSNSDGRIGIYAKHLSGGSQFIGSFDYFRNFAGGTTPPPTGLTPVRNFMFDMGE